MKTNDAVPGRIERLMRHPLSLLSIVIGSYLLILPVVAITLLFALGIGVSLLVDPMSADAGGWLVVFGIIFVGPLAGAIYLLEVVFGAGLGVLGWVRFKEGRLLPVLGVLLNLGALLGNAAFFTYVFLELSAYP